MTSSVAQMTAEELKSLIGSVVEDKLVEIFGDIDEDVMMKKGYQNRLVRQHQAVVDGARGESFEDVVSKLGLR